MSMTKTARKLELALNLRANRLCWKRSAFGVWNANGL